MQTDYDIVNKLFLDICKYNLDSQTITISTSEFSVVSGRVCEGCQQSIPTVANTPSSKNTHKWPQVATAWH